MSQNNIVTKSDLAEMYQKILPYLGGGQKLAGPVGMVISYMGNTAPNGYLACDGSWYDIGDYPKLANWMMAEFNSYSYFALSGETVQSGKFKVPDLRGEFLRGSGTNSHANQGSGANVGVHQDGTLSPYMFHEPFTNDGSLYASGNSFLQPSNTDKTIADTSGVRWYAKTTKQTLSSNLNYTSRPTNTSVLYCIKYEEYEGDGAGEVYSTTERVVGKWIDGSAIYQKTIQTTSPASTSSSNNVSTEEVSISNADVIVSVNGFIKTSNQTITLPNTWVSGYQTGLVTTIASSTKVNVAIYVSESSHSTWKNATAYITLQYTKTTT